jgi:hypothetical protein
MGNEQIKLNRILRLLLALLSDEEEPAAAIRLLGFPQSIEIRQFALEAQPPISGLDNLLEFRKCSKGTEGVNAIARPRSSLAI